MRVVYAPTSEQEKMLSDLISHMYSTVFPRYFTDREITDFVDLKILHYSGVQDDQLNTLGDVFKAISSLQVIISILELPSDHNVDSNYSSMFNQNIKILERCGMFFPFTYDQFFGKEKKNRDIVFSIFSKPSNDLLI